MLLLLIFSVFISLSDASLTNGVTEFYAKDTPVHMIVSGNVLITDEPRMLTSRSTIPHRPSIENVLPSVPLIDDDGVSYISNGHNTNKNIRYFYSNIIQKKQRKKRHRRKKQHRKWKLKARKHVKKVKNHLKKRTKEEAGEVRDKIPEEHVKASRKTLYPPPSNMWVINQELTDTEESLRNTGKLGAVEQPVLDQPYDEQQYILPDGQLSEYPHPEIESFDASTNFRTKEKVPKLVHRDKNNPKESKLSYGSMGHDKYDQEIESMFNKGKHRKVFGTYGQQQDDSNEYHDKVNELQSRVKDLTDNANDNKVEEVYITHGGTHTVNGKQVKPSENAPTNSEQKQNLANFETGDKEGTKDEESNNIKENIEEKEYANSFKEKFLKLYSPQAPETGNHHVELLSQDNTAKHDKRNKEKESINGESSVKQGGYLLHGEETESKFKPHIKALVVQTKMDKVNLDEAAANGIPIETPKPHENNVAQASGSFSPEDVENPAGYTPSELNHAPKSKESTTYVPNSLESTSYSSSMAGPNINYVSKIPESTNHVLKTPEGKQYSIESQKDTSSDNLLPAESLPDSKSDTASNNLLPAEGLPDTKSDTASNHLLPAKSLPYLKSAYPNAQPSFKELLTERIKENLSKINPNGATIKAEKLVKEALQTPHTDTTHSTHKEQSVVYPRPSFNELKSHKSEDEKTSHGQVDNSEEFHNSLISNEMQQNLKSDMQEALEPDDKIDSKTEKPVTARNDPEENQMTITADPSNEGTGHNSKNSEKYDLEKEEFSHISNKDSDNIPSEGLLDKPRAIQYLLHKDSLKHKTDPTTYQSEQSTLQTPSESSSNTGNSPGSSSSNYQVTSKSNANEDTAQNNVVSSERTDTQQNNAVSYQRGTDTQHNNVVSSDSSDTQQKNIVSTQSTDAPPNNAVSSQSTDVLNAQTSNSASIEQPEESSNALQNDPNDITTNYASTYDQENNQVASEQQSLEQQNPANTLSDNTNIQQAPSKEIQPQEQSITVPDTIATVQQPSVLESQPIEVAIKNNVNEPSTTFGSNSDVTVSTPEEVALTPPTADVSDFIASPPTQENSNKIEDKTEGLFTSKQNKVDSVAVGSNPNNLNNAEANQLLKPVKVKEPSMFEAISWPSGVNPGAMFSSELHPEIANEKGILRENAHFNTRNEETSNSPGYPQKVVAELNQQEPYETSSSNVYTNNVMNLLKPRRPTGPSIGFDNILPGATRGIYTSSKSKAKVQVSSNSASSSSSNTNTAKENNNKVQSSTGTGASTRHHDKPAKPDGYGYGSGSGYGYGTKSWGYGGGGGWSGNPPPKGMNININPNPPPNIPGFPDGANGAPAPAPAPGSAPAPAPASGSATPATAPAAQPAPPAQPPVTGGAGTSHTPTGNNPPTSNQNHQSSEAVGPNSVPPSYVGAKVPIPVKQAGKLKEKFNTNKNPKIDKITISNVKTLHEKVSKIKKLHTQNKFEQYKPGQPLQQIQTIPQGKRIPRINYIPKNTNQPRTDNTLKRPKMSGYISKIPDDDK